MNPKFDRIHRISRPSGVVTLIRFFRACPEHSEHVLRCTEKLSQRPTPIHVSSAHLASLDEFGKGSDSYPNFMQIIAIRFAKAKRDVNSRIDTNMRK